MAEAARRQDMIVTVSVEELNARLLQDCACVHVDNCDGAFDAERL